MDAARSMIADVSYKQALLQFLQDEILDGQGELDEGTPLLEYGVIDSLSMVSVLSFIRARFGVEVRSDSITVSNFENVNALARMVAELSARQDSRPSVRHMRASSSLPF